MNSIHIEVQLDISSITGEKDAYGTSDVIMCLDDTMFVGDLKYGKGVPVTAENNPQLQIYALAALEHFALVQSFSKVRMAIFQPRNGGLSECEMTVEELLAIKDSFIAPTAKVALSPNAPLVPGDEQCKFCRGKAICPALRKAVMDEFEVCKPVSEVTEDILASGMAKVDLVEFWCKAVREETERRLIAGTDVPGWKLVEGRKGIRKWTSEAAVAKVCNGLGINTDLIYERALASPTSVEKLAKTGKIGPEEWDVVKDFITRSDGKPSVAPMSDPRPPISVAVIDDFQTCSSPKE